MFIELNEFFPTFVLSHFQWGCIKTCIKLSLVYETGKSECESRVGYPAS